MRVLVYGGSGSGKSAFAENLLAGFPDAGERCYVATMRPDGREAAARIARHRENRRYKGFVTIECMTGMENVDLPDKPIVLLECLGNLLANEMFSPGGSGQEAEDAVRRGLNHLDRAAEGLIVVSNDVFSDGVVYPEETERFRQSLAALNRELAERCDTVVETVCGIPLHHKGGGA